MSSNWSLESLRLSIFTADQPKGTEADWTFLTGQDEAEVRQNVPGGKVYVGDFGLGRLTLGFGPNRVDVIMGIKADFAEDAAVPAFAEWDAGIDEFQSVASKFLANFTHPVARLALGSVMLQQAPDEKSVNSILSGYLKSAKIQPDTEDFLYRINSPTRSNILPLKLNRILSLGSVKIQRGSIRVGGNEAGIVMGGQVFAARLELDHSTDAANASPLDRSLLVPIWDELVGLGRQNVESGEL